MQLIRNVIHIDMDTFYASVEQRDQPELKGKSVIMVGDPHWDRQRSPIMHIHWPKKWIAGSIIFTDKTGINEDHKHHMATSSLKKAHLEHFLDTLRK